MKLYNPYVRHCPWFKVMVAVAVTISSQNLTLQEIVDKCGLSDCDELKNLYFAAEVAVVNFNLELRFCESYMLYVFKSNHGLWSILSYVNL